MIIKPLIIASLETALNQYLSLDEDVSLFLAPLKDKIIAVTILPFNETIYLCPTDDKIQILENYITEADTTITGSLSALGLMGLSTTPMRSLFSGEVTIQGDNQVAQTFQQLFKKLDIDLEEKLSQLTGDILAHKIGNLFRSTQSWSKESLESLQLNTKEFLQEETHDLPTKPEIDIFYQHVDTIRADFDRLDARIKQLKTA